MLSPGRQLQSATGATHSLATHGSSSRCWPSVATGKESLLNLFALFLLFLLFSLFFFSLLLVLSLGRHYGLPQRQCMAKRTQNDPSQGRHGCPSRSADDAPSSLLLGGPRGSSLANLHDRAGGRNGRKLTTGEDRPGPEITAHDQNSLFLFCFLSPILSLRSFSLLVIRRRGGRATTTWPNNTVPAFGSV